MIIFFRLVVSDFITFSSPSFSPSSAAARCNNTCQLQHHISPFLSTHHSSSQTHTLFSINKSAVTLSIRALCVCVFGCVWFGRAGGFGAAIDDFKAAETGAVTGDAHPPIPPLQIGGEGDFQEVRYKCTQTHKNCTIHVHAPSELQSHAMHTHSKWRGMCVFWRKLKVKVKQGF